MDRLQHNVLFIDRILRDLGPIHLEGSHLMAGRKVLDYQETFVDEMSTITGGDVTIFRGDLRVATTLRQDGQRAVNTRLAKGPIYTTLFERGEAYCSPAHVLGADLYAVYQPLRGPDGKIVGAFALGLPRKQFRDTVVEAQRSIALSSLPVLFLATLAFSALSRPIKREIDDRERNLRQLAERLDLAFGNMSDGMTVFDGNRCLVAFNARYASIYNVDPTLLRPGMTLLDLLTVHNRNGTLPVGEDIVEINERIKHQHRDGRSGEEIFESKEGRTFTIRYQGLADGGWVSTHRDITSQTRDQERMRFLALRDPLTGLANRTAFDEALLHHLDDPTPCFAVFLIDLDRFKAINDLHGHGGGDAVLCEQAARLARQIQGTSIAARLGGDEFALLIEDMCSPGALEALAESIIVALSEPVTFKGALIRGGASIGVTSAGDTSLTLDEVLGQADLALYTAKARGRGVFDLFRPALSAARQDRYELELEMVAALEAGGFVLHYQPQYAVKSGELVGFEALVRWKHPTRGLLHPAEFIAVAEDSGHIVRLGRWVLEQACRDAARWGSNLRIAVNVSPVQLARASFVADTIAVATQAGLQPALLEVEVTETVLLENTPEVIAALSALRRAGIRVALDDFGTGYSSLLYLRQFPFDCIKIDQIFVRDLESLQETASIAGIIIQLARSFGAETVAEGVEQQAQIARLQTLGCDFAQGFHLGSPVPFDSAMAMVLSQATR
ncbi:MAG: putative bifunctional diguanylate cyclase/phosphodiesterase [Janthinobacterium lividum]